MHYKTLSLNKHVHPDYHAYANGFQGKSEYLYQVPLLVYDFVGQQMNQDWNDGE